MLDTHARYQTLHLLCANLEVFVYVKISNYKVQPHYDVIICLDFTLIFMGIDSVAVGNNLSP